MEHLVEHLWRLWWLFISKIKSYKKLHHPAWCYREVLLWLVSSRERRASGQASGRLNEVETRGTNWSSAIWPVLSGQQGSQAPAESTVRVHMWSGPSSVMPLIDYHSSLFESKVTRGSCMLLMQSMPPTFKKHWDFIGIVCECIYVCIYIYMGSIKLKLASKTKNKFYSSNMYLTYLES